MGDGYDIGYGTPIDAGRMEAFGQETELTPLDIAVLERPMSEQELRELLNELEALEFQPFQEVEHFNEMPIDYDTVFGGLDEYDFDGKDINHDATQLNWLLDGFQEGNWSNLDLSEQKERISDLFEYVNDVLELENPPKIEYYQGGEGEYGGFNPVSNTLSINEIMLHESDEAADTVAHELWHAYQHERASNPHSEKDFLYQFGFENYIRPSDDFDGYQSQLVEAEARAFADQFKGALAQLRGRF